MRQNKVLRYTRQLRGWSQATLAKQLSTTAQQVSRWERGETHPSPYYCEQLCQIFGKDAEALGLIPFEVQVENQSPNCLLQHDQPIGSDPCILDPLRPRFSSTSGSIIRRDQLVTQTLRQLENGRNCALSGLPGVGKTTLVQLILNHPTYATIFPGGYLWINLGHSPDISSELARLTTLLGVSEQERTHAHSIEEWSLLLHQALGNRRILLIVDDAWSIKDVLPFIMGGPSVAHIITMRSPQLALAVTDDAIMRVPEFSTEECLQLLNTLVPGFSTIEHDLLDKVLRLTGGLPQAVAICGKYLRMHAVGETSRRLNAALRSLITQNTQLQLNMPQPPTLLQPSLNALITHSLATTIALSDQQLPYSAQEAWRALSVLPPKPHHFPESAALAVIQQDIKVLDTLVDAGLLENARNGWYQMHQTITDYARFHRDDQMPLYRLIHYARQSCSSPSFATSYNFNAILPTILAAIEAANTLGQDRDLIQMELALEPFLHTQCSPKQADMLLTLALDAASRIKNQEASSLFKFQQDKLAQCQDFWVQTTHLENLHVNAL